MMNLLDMIKLAEDLPEYGLQAGDEGTIVELLAPDVFLVEFSDENGRTFAMPELKSSQIAEVVYRHKPSTVQPTKVGLNAAKQVKVAGIHVTPSDNEWLVKREGSAQVITRRKTKAEAISMARKIAKITGSKLVVHQKNDAIHQHNNRNDDPKPPQNNSH